LYPLEADATPYPFEALSALREEPPPVVAVPLLFPNGEFEGLIELDCAVPEEGLLGLETPLEDNGVSVLQEPTPAEDAALLLPNGEF